MPGQETGDGKDPGVEEGKKAFIRERIVKKDEPDLRRIGLKFLLVSGLAVAFGVVASLTFVLSRNVWEGAFPGTTVVETITIPRDESTEVASREEDPSGSSEEVSPEETEGESTEETAGVYEVVQSMIDSHTAGLRDYEAIFTQVGSLVTEFNRSMVMLAHTEESGQGVDEQIPGAIIAITADEVLILSDTRMFDAPAQMQVVFSGQSQMTAQRKAVDGTSHMVVYSLPTVGLSETVSDYIRPAVLGDSHAVAQGNPVIAVGSPIGMAKSAEFGMVSYVNMNVSGIDRQIRLFVTDMEGYPDSCGFLLNLRGEIVGRVTSEYDGSGRSGQLAAESISDLKGYIEHLSNGVAPACLGITGTTITRGMIDKKGVDGGIYITSCQEGGAAYTAGLQRGDILTAINGERIISVRELQNFLDGLSVGETVSLTIFRDSRDEYKQMTFTAVLKER